MTTVLETASTTETWPRPTLLEDAQILRRDARTLRKAIRRSVSTSPEAFLKTIDDVNALSIEYLEKDIREAAWVVIQKGKEVVGIAVSRRPHREMDRDIDPEGARFIESVWIAPGLRGKQMGERLVRFLFEVECEKNPKIKQFFLWVFEENHRAIRLYDRMKFVDTKVRQKCNVVGRTEIKYRLTLDTAVAKATETATNEAARRDDANKYGVTYRVLGA